MGEKEKFKLTFAPWVEIKSRTVKTPERIICTSVFGNDTEQSECEYTGRIFLKNKCVPAVLNPS